MEYKDCYIFNVNTKSRAMRLKIISVFVQKNILNGIILCYSRNDQFSYNCLINYVPSINNRPLIPCSTIEDGTFTVNPSMLQHIFSSHNYCFGVSVTDALPKKLIQDLLNRMNHNLDCTITDFPMRPIPTITEEFKNVSDLSNIELNLDNPEINRVFSIELENEKTLVLDINVTLE